MLAAVSLSSVLIRLEFSYSWQGPPQLCIHVIEMKSEGGGWDGEYLQGTNPL